MTTPPIADADARREALNPAGSYIVQAPAGSGKTELLTQRYLALLALVNAPEEILAITFTNKASGEMRNRILGALDKGAKQETAPQQAHELTTWQLARAALARDAEQNWQLLDNPSRLRVLTFDSLCHALARQMPVLSGFGAPPGISDEIDELYLLAARNTVAALEEAPQDGVANPTADAVERLLAHLDNDRAGLERLLMDMLRRRDQWLRHLLTIGDTQARELLQQALRRLVEDALAAALELFSESLRRQLVDLLQFSAPRAEARSPFGSEFPAARGEDLPAWRAVAALLLTDKNEWRKKVDKKQGFPAKTEAGNEIEKKLFVAMKQQMMDVLGSLQGDLELQQALADVRLLPQPLYSDTQWEILDALYHALLLAAGHLNLVFREGGEVDYTAVAVAARQALGEPEQPTDLALALDYRIQHLLVDEFQDTSLSQYQLLQSLTAGWQPEDGRTLFVVGDPMQSIYRFREAEVGLFLRARRSGVGEIPLHPLTLKVNFRSQGGVVEWVNQTFRRIFPRQENIAAGAVPYSASTAFHPDLPGPAVTPLISVHPKEEKAGQAALEARQVVELIQQARRENPGGSVAILVRGRAHLVAIAPALKQAGLRFRAVEIEQLGQRPAVQDVLALTRALLHPADRVAWLAVLRAPWCGLELHDLYALAGDAPNAALPDLLADEAHCQRLSPGGQARLARAWPPLRLALANRRRAGLRDWVEGAWLALGGPACVADSTALEDAEVFFALLEKLDHGGDLSDFQKLREKTEELFAQPDVEADERLQVMTIHKAKGLEFDTVILPGLGRKPPNPDSRLLMWLERPRRHDHTDLLLAPIKAADADEDPIYQYLRRLDQQKSEYEDGRLLYVAATRAKQRLFLLAQAPANKDGAANPQGGSLLARLWPALAGEGMPPGGMFCIPARMERGNEEVSLPAGEGRKLSRLPQDWQLPSPPAPLVVPPAQEIEQEPIDIEYRWAGETARHIGRVAHQVLQRYASGGQPRQAAALREFSRVMLARQGMSGADLENAARRVEEAVAKTLADPRGHWILDANHADAHCEYPLTASHKGKLLSVVLDRTFIDADGTRWIIDYKTGAHEGGSLEAFLDQEQQRYRPQLALYATLMRLREPSRPIRLGLYFPLLQSWREWEF
jgi:ATP-dependent exoDNAse (exonuclease V) beta subunit